ncbi:GlsB/YeaQ/YmgE family stress response membrane protein [Verrucomicrobium sp. BvORR106]|uniref:GlsB/YeaQ/YmgE family stress response membrane protein n=1 Tax=Verrucomicrobium sp. BvORR106 TaxID=1403819 RepID=UPI0005705397|nr:GlsB/YeaQ/YmgE family stress response membrane protein [Verrucomicrobium sp. BvORR106]
MGILSWIILGLIAGALAKLIMPGDQKGGCILTSVLGIAGGIVGGWLGSTLFGWGDVNAFDFRSLGIAIIGSLILLLGFRLVSGRK